MQIWKRYAYLVGVCTILIIISLNTGPCIELRLLSFFSRPKLTCSSSKYYVDNRLPPPNYVDNRLLNKSAWFSNIDLIIPWQGQQRNHRNGTDVRRERDNNEIPYLLHSIAKNAPWVRKVWILVNKDNVPSYAMDIPESIKYRTSIIDRCTFMPNGTCPTRNAFSVGAFVHHLPDLSEWFVWVEDDIFLGRVVTPFYFYEDGKPFVWQKKPSWGFFQGQEFHRLYQDPSVVSFATPLSSCPCPHYWYPQLKSVFASMEKQYPKFYQFLGNHTEGRYFSLAKGASDEENSQEEDFFGWMNWELLRTGKGVYKNIVSERYEWWDEVGEVEISKEGFENAVKDQPIFMNVNDRFSKDEKTYKEEIGWFHAAMETMFSDNQFMKENWKITAETMEQT